MKKNTRGFPKGPTHGGAAEMHWDYTSRDKKRKHHDKVKARRRVSVQQRKAK